MPDYIVAAEPRLGSDDVIVGTELAKNLGVAVGDKINVSAASDAMCTLTISGLLDFGNKGANQHTAVVFLRTAQSLLGMIGGLTTININFKDAYDAEILAQKIQAAYPVEADSWIATNAQFFSAVRAQSMSMRGCPRKRRCSPRHRSRRRAWGVPCAHWPVGIRQKYAAQYHGLLDRPSEGRIWIKGSDTSTLDEAEITALRGHIIGFVFQYHMLISAFTAVENVMMPMLADRGFARPAMEERAWELIRRVNLESVGNNRATNMSGGQQQRVAVARALAMKPDLILADEPTGNLDTKSANDVFALMRDVNRESGTSFLLVTHNMDLARRCDRIIELVDGRIVSS